MRNRQSIKAMRLNTYVQSCMTMEEDGLTFLYLTRRSSQSSDMVRTVARGTHHRGAALGLVVYNEYGGEEGRVG
jgi:hypothetical protein